LIQEHDTVPPEPRRFVATAGQSGLTVLAALRHWLPGTSWSSARKLLAGRHVTVNGALCLDEARRLKAGETVALYGATLRSAPSAETVRLVWLDPDVVVVDKPAGMMTLRHAAERNWSARRKERQPALDDLIPQLIANHEGQCSRTQRRLPPVYSVHRIDRDTSGLILFARSPQARQHLIRQFKKHTVERTYLAVAHGEVAAQTIESFLVDDRGDGKRGSTTVEGTGKRAVTHLRPVEQLDSFTLLECRLETGRTHQIRIHLSEAGHPVYGDNKYGNTEADRRPARLDRTISTADTLASGMPPLALHAATLGFRHPMTGQQLRFESKPPADFLLLVERLRRRTAGK
jgi:23S rRNA pseudouridine1911/1915/1917 synthase